MNKYILLIDDDEEELEIFSEALNEIKKPMSCIQSRSGASAISLLSYLMLDYIFLDLNMPEMDGLKCLDEIKKTKEPYNVPVILYSHTITDETYKRAFEAGAAACIKKPATVHTLAEILQEIFSIDVPLKNALFLKGKNI